MVAKVLQQPPEHSVFAHVMWLVDDHEGRPPSALDGHECAVDRGADHPCGRSSPVSTPVIVVFGRCRQVARSSRLTRSFAFYGAFAAKVLLVHSRRLLGWVLPAAGGTLAIFIGAL